MLKQSYKKRNARSPIENGNEEKPLKNKKQRKKTRNRNKSNKKQHKKKQQKQKRQKVKRKLHLSKKMKGKKNKEKNDKSKKNIKTKKKTTDPRQACSGTTPVSSTCIENAMNVLVFERIQVTNYLKQSKQLIRHGTQADNKRGKKGEFVHAAEHMLMAIGGNLSKPLCGTNTTDASTRKIQHRALDLHLENYDKLMNCSAAIQEACVVPENAYNETALVKIKACNASMEEFRNFTKTCMTNDMKNDATTQCACWAEGKTKMDAIKAQKCSINKEKKEVTAEKKKCVKVFTVCKKMEDASIQLIHTCMADHSMKLINQTAESLHSGAMKDTGKDLAGAEEKAKDVVSGNADIGKQLDDDPYNDHE